MIKSIDRIPRDRNFLNDEVLSMEYDNGLSIMVTQKLMNVYDDNGELICRINVTKEKKKKKYKLEK